MKKLIFLSCLMYLCWGCGNRIQVKRTVTKTLTFPFVINETKAFGTSSVITADQITNLFDPDIFVNSNSVLEKMDINSFNISGNVNPQNTATEVTVRAYVSTGGNVPLLDDTKLIRIGGNQLLQDVKDLLNTTNGQINKEISFANALAAINAVGVQRIQTLVTENLKGVNKNGITVVLTGGFPAGQRLSGTITLTINATLTYSRCEIWTEFPYPIGSENEC